MSEHARKTVAAQAVTVPAPLGSAASATDGETPEAARPTTVPDYNIEALVASLRTNKEAPLPIDLTVPTRIRSSAVERVSLRAAFLLSHVDDRMSVAELATCAQIPLADAIECFTRLAELGLVELRGVTSRSPAPPSDPRPPPTVSGVHKKR